MSDDFLISSSQTGAASSPRSRQNVASSTLYSLIEAVVAMTEKNKAQHKLVTRDLAETREGLQSAFNSFAGETQKAYQQLRQELTGEKRVSLALLNELLELCQDLEQISAARPEIPEGSEHDALRMWAEAIDVQKRKAQAAISRHGIFPYDAEIGSPYRPELHERVGSCQVEGMGPMLVAEQRDRGYASQHPEFILRRPRVLISE